MNGELKRLRDVERWIGWVRLGAVPFAIFQVAIGRNYPGDYRLWAWVTTGLLAVGTLLIFWLSRRDWPKASLKRLGFAALTFDFAIVSAYTLIYSFEPSSPIRQLMYLPLVEAALRYGIRGALVVVVASAPVMVAFEWLRERRLAPRSYHLDYVTLQLGLEVLLGLIVGWLMLRLLGQTTVAESRAAESERLRDQLGRRADVLEAANRCARALSSSLELDQAFDAFIREVRGLMPFDRIAIVLSENGIAQVMAVAGAGAEDVLPPGSGRPIHGTLLEELLRTNHTVYRKDMAAADYPEEDEFLALGLRCRLATSLLQGARSIGMLSLVRREPDSFTVEEIELAGLLGRLVASAVQNISAYEAERKTVEELRRLSALRADFVSLVSHELRTPMAAVIGAARTLQQRWRELSADQRESFLELIASETGRLADLITDVLDTSRIEAGTFSFRFADVDIGQLVRDAVATAQVGQDEVRLLAQVQDPLPDVRGDAERLRQVLTNLIDNAIKYSTAGGDVEVRAYPEDGRVYIDVRDHGPGIAKEDQRLIFEKFGRVTSTGTTLPGTGLGLFIARSIAEAHGGGLEVDSAPNQGATFTLEIPIGG
ncbi:MAG TPA: GAF domain-containing sensor histidine kinase [Gaiellaceae bacterium]|nr:GAF domain-containing sensor histidine kinase [Gaiellaceae bacterium]